MVTCQTEALTLPESSSSPQFWRRSLWERAGARLDAQYNLVAHCELWTRLC